MSSPAQGGPSVPKDKEKEKKGLGKVLSRMKTVLKKADPSRRLSTLGSSKPAAAPAAAAAPSKPAEPAAAQGPAAVEATKIPRSQIFAERAKKIGELYGLELKPSEWYSTEGNALRVEKPIRMRVHRKCHVCDTSFGRDKECPKCKHQRCKQCPRVPPKRTEAEKEESRKRRAAILKERAEKAPIIPDWDPTPKKIVLKRPAKTGGQDLIYRKPRQRLRRTCCQCQRLFTGTKTCEGCQHIRCTDCPRDPPKKDKYPYGYPGDAPGTRIAHYQLEPEPDPEILKSIQARIEAMNLK
ncbi:d1aa4710-022c-4f89-bb0f-16fff965fa17 [Thermothielavioides terrestris]|uniref:D1aa4710-022c-4f89-bb0f-16fff965fa17 n=1 Tax=Thermothielavioides terrestris TaxID=2587410 RepID=A0A3S4B2N9_9PEZI|nr:d1aa4710-022c-4f89-bb0f-16fff965fa17 [Thermothielavioides terrestris]